MLSDMLHTPVSEFGLSMTFTASGIVLQAMVVVPQISALTLLPTLALNRT